MNRNGNSAKLALKLRRFRDVVRIRLIPSKATLVVFSLTFGVALPVMCAVLELHYSPYYQFYAWLVHRSAPAEFVAAEDGRLLGQLIVENDHRVAAAKSYLEGQQAFRYLAEGDDTDIGKRDNAGASDARPNDWRVVMVTIISSRREVFVAGDGQRDGFRFAPHYLVQNVARFLQLITERRSRRLAPVEYRLAVCSVGEEMTPEESYLAQLVPVFRNAEAAKVGVHSAKRFDPWFDQMAWRFEKEKRDYVFCIRKTVERLASEVSRDSTGRQPQYLLMVEDDALPKNETLLVVERLISGHWSSRIEPNESVQRLTYVKLYHPSRLHGYLSLETERLPQLLAMALLGGFALHFARLLTIQSVEPRPPTLTVSCVFAGLLALAVGRVHFDRWRHLFPPYGHYAVPDNFCCTQAVFYARQAAVDLADYLDVVRCNETFHKDDALWSFGRSTGHGAKAGLLVQPNLFEHVGLYSGLRGGFVDPHIFIADK